MIYRFYALNIFQSNDTKEEGIRLRWKIRPKPYTLSKFAFLIVIPDKKAKSLCLKINL